MNEIIQSTLVALEDVPGVQGSFVVRGDGSVLAMRMPALFDAAMLAELAPRLERLAESFSSVGDDLESCVLRYADHLLCVKMLLSGGSLCVLSAPSVNLSALRMAVSLADRRISNATRTIQSPAVRAPQPPAPPRTPPAAPPAAAPARATTPPEEAPPSARKPPRYFRGHLIED